MSNNQKQSCDTPSNQCTHTAIVSGTDAAGKVTWHCASCLRGFFPSGDTGAEQEAVRLRYLLNGARAYVRSFAELTQHPTARADAMKLIERIDGLRPVETSDVMRLRAAIEAHRRAILDIDGVGSTSDDALWALLKDSERCTCFEDEHGPDCNEDGCCGQCKGSSVEPSGYCCPNCANAGCTDCQPETRNLGPEAPGGVGVIDLAARSPEKATEEDLRRRPTGQCSWGCYYSDDGRLVRDSACTVHGASSENGKGDGI